MTYNVFGGTLNLAQLNTTVIQKATCLTAAANSVNYNTIDALEYTTVCM